MAQRDSVFTQTVRKAFYQVAADAVEQGLLTAEQRDIIGWYSNRKGVNWVRRLRNLCSYIEDKQARENGHCDTKRGSSIRQDTTKRNSTR